MSPLLSVVIPTYKRPVLLERAIESALQAAPEGNVEVVVVPNGPDDSWKVVAHNRRTDTRIKWHYLIKGNACAARNHGLAMSSGKYIRFLDDDDILLASAVTQIKCLEEIGAEISLAPLKISCNSKNKYEIADLPFSEDFVEIALLSIRGSFLTEGAVFLRSAIKDCLWAEDAVLYDDYIWMLEVAKKKEWNWIKFNQPVSVYLHHFGDRLSFTKRNLSNSSKVVDSIIDIFNCCKDSSRLSEGRTRAAATALLTHAHSAFPASPFYLSHVIAKAHSICAIAKPSHPIFERYSLLSKNLIAIEWAILPLRYVSRGYRRASLYAKGFMAPVASSTTN